MIILPSGLLGVFCQVILLANFAQGSYDWHLPLIGIPLPSPAATRFLRTTSSLNSSVLFTLTERSVLAALEVSSGAIRWRRELGTKADGVTFLSCGNEELTLLVAPRTLQSLSASTGQVQWQTLVPRTSAALPVSNRPLEAICWDFGGISGVLVASTEGVDLFERSTGTLLWHDSAPIGSKLIQLVSVNSERAAAIFLREGVAWLVIFDRRGNSLPTRVELGPLSCEAEMSVIVGGDDLALLWLDGGALETLVVGMTPESAGVHSTSRLPRVFHDVLDASLLDQQTIVIKSQDMSSAAVGLVNGHLETLWRLPVPALLSSALGQPGARYIGALTRSRSSLGLIDIQITSISAGSGARTLVQESSFPLDSTLDGAPTSFAFEPNPSSNSNLDFRGIFVTENGKIQMWDNGRMVWSRDEALASLALPPLPATIRGKPPKLGDTFPFGLSAALRNLHLVIFRNSIAPVALDRRILVLVSSVSPSVYALDDAGQILWRAVIPLPSHFQWETLTLRSHPSPLGDSTIVLFGSHLTPAKTFARYHVYLATDTGEILLMEASNSTSTPNHFRVEMQTLQGYKNGVTGAQAHAVWSFQLGDGNSVNSVNASNSDRVASLGRVLGNRTSLIKYLNPHLVVATSLQPKTRSASIHLLDVESGAVTFSINEIHGIDSLSNLKVLMQDNWLLYSYRVAGDPASTTHIVSVELHQSPAVARLLSRSSLKPLSSQLSASSRSFVSDEGLSLRGLTRTALGITSHDVLFVTRTGRLVAVPQKMLDPRRVYGKVDKNDQEERLIPYETKLRIQARWNVVYDQKVLGVSNIVPFPSLDRESQANVVAFGLDLAVFTRSPSRSFDVLDSTFNKAQLALTIGALGAALALVQKSFQAKRLSQSWY